VLIEKVWPDWENAIQAEQGEEGILVFERWFVRPADTNTGDIASKIAISSYAILSSLLSTKSASTLRPRSLEIISSLLVKLNASFNIRETYLSTLSTSLKPYVTISEDSDDEDERIDPTILAVWDQSIKDLMGIPTRFANAWGVLSEQKGTRIGEDLPTALDLESVFTLLSSATLLISMSTGLILQA